MENILQSIVKIIIIGSLYDNVNCSRQFLPPLPYYQNEDHFLPGFAPPFRGIVPVYYQEQNSPPPISYPNVNSYILPQLFYQNENYNPSQFARPGTKYSASQFFPYKPSFYQPYKPPQEVNYEVPQIHFKKPVDIPAVPSNRPAEASSKKSAFFATNIVVKEETQPPYYHDDYNKNYHDEDYNDNYSDDSPSQSEPCVSDSPYRYFESPKLHPNSPNIDNKYTLCNPYFQPNFGNGVYTLKMPITLLPSRFPPRVEQLIERIQNYFSTYTQQESSKPHNQTSTTVQPLIEASSENIAQSTAVMEDIKKNTTEPDFEQTNSQQSEVTTAKESSNLEKVTQKTIVLEIEENEEEISSTSIPNAQIQKESQMVVQSTPSPNGGTEDVFVTKDRQELLVNEQTQKTDSKNSSLSENQSADELNDSGAEKVETPEIKIHSEEVKGLSSTTESDEERNRIKESTSVQSTYTTLREVDDNNG